MNPERWGQIERLYHAGLERAPKDRGKFIAKACGSDTELRSDLESLLADAKTTEAFLEKPAIEFAAPVLVDDHARHHGIDTDRPRADFRRHETGHARCSPRPPWWMYLIAASFLAHVVFITAFWFLGPESMGIQASPTKSHPVVSKVVPDSPAERAAIRRQGRAALLAQTDPELRREIESLLAQPDSDVFLDRPALENATELVGSPGGRPRLPGRVSLSMHFHPVTARGSEPRWV